MLEKFSILLNKLKEFSEKLKEFSEKLEVLPTRLGFYCRKTSKKRPVNSCPQEGKLCTKMFDFDQYAHKLVDLIGQYVNRQPAPQLEDKLFYLWTNFRYVKVSHWINIRRRVILKLIATNGKGNFTPHFRLLKLKNYSMWILFILHKYWRDSLKRCSVRKCFFSLHV